MIRWLPFLFSVLVLKGQSIDSKTIFPADSRAFVQTEDKDLIQTVCPGHIEKDGKVECGKNCPSSSGLDMGQHIFDLSLIDVTRGHFLSAASDDAVISTEGCESHSENFGGSILLTRRAERWIMLWYQSGVETLRCHKVQLKSGRGILVCLGEYGGQGNVWMQLYIEDLVRPQGSLMAENSHGIFEVFDNSTICGGNVENESKPSALTHTLIEKIEFAASAPAGNATIVVEFSLGRRAMTPEAVKACYAAPQPRQAPFTPTMHRYRMEFVFHGSKFVPTPSSAALAKRLDLR